LKVTPRFTIGASEDFAIKNTHENYWAATDKGKLRRQKYKLVGLANWEARDTLRFAILRKRERKSWRSVFLMTEIIIEYETAKNRNLTSVLLL
jgi:hypothetical protein